MSEQTKVQFDLSAINRVRRISDRGHYDKETIFGIVDKALIAHVGFVEDGRPVVIPMTCARVGESLLIHGARKSRIMETVDGFPVCVTVTHVDALVYARSIFHSSMNYRSAVIHGTALPIDDPEEKLAALEAMSEHLMPGRWSEVRAPLAKELMATQVMRIELILLPQRYAMLAFWMTAKTTRERNGQKPGQEFCRFAPRRANR